VKFSIYALLFENIDACYIGATGCPDTREQYHIQQLSERKHCNYRVQAAWDASGGAMTFKTIDCFDVEFVDDVCERERQWMLELIETHGRWYLLNIKIDSQPESFAVYKLPRRDHAAV
jgi:hypothetical protein